MSVRPFRSRISSPLEHQPDQKLPEPFNSIGAEAVGSLNARVLSSVFPSQLQWFKLDMDAKLKMSDEVPGELKDAIAAQLFRQEVILQSVLESANIFVEAPLLCGFRTQMRAVIDQVLVTGDSLFMLTDDYRIVVYRRDQYVTKRDSCGDVLCHVIKGIKYGLSLTDEQTGKGQVVACGSEKEPYQRRMVDLYTLVEWEPSSKSWTWKQEVNNEIINTGGTRLAGTSPSRLTLPRRRLRARHDRAVPGEVRTTNELGAASTGVCRACEHGTCCEGL